MATPVLIAARNEAAHIGKTLAALPRNTEPIVIPNGCTDETETIAEQLGVTVIKDSPEGKMPALQLGIRYLGERAAEPFITMDADTRPLLPDVWLKAMLAGRAALDPQRPAVVVGLQLYRGINPFTAGWRNLGYLRDTFKNHTNPYSGADGKNMLLDLHDAATVKRILDMPHIWPREDTAIKDEVLDREGSFLKSLNPLTLVLTSGDRYPGLYKRLRLGGRAAGLMVRESYLQEAAPGSVPYWELRGEEPDGSPAQGSKQSSN